MRRWSRLSLQAKLPLMLALLLLAICGTMAAITHHYIKTSAEELAAGRLQHAATQLGDLLSQSVRQRLRLVQTTADKGDAAAYLREPTDARRTVLAAALTAHIGKDVQTAAIEVWNGDARTQERAGVEFDPIPEEARRAWLASLMASPRGMVGPFRREGERLTFSVVWPLSDQGRVQGYIVERRVLSQTPQTAMALGGLIGKEAALLLGNAADDTWTDMSQIVPAPPVDHRVAGPWHYARPNGQTMIAHAVAIADSPWLVAVEFPYATVVLPAQRFLFTALTALVLLSSAGAVGAWAICRRVTTPLVAVTEAAEALASGQPAPPVATGRLDEVGRLAHSFNAMATEVTEARRRLEEIVSTLDARVRARTSELEQANRELEAFSYSVSHDLRAPLRAVDGFARILVEDHREALPAEARNCVDVIAHRTRHMGQLIDDLLAFSRLGRQPMTRGPVDMTAIASASVDEATRAAGDRAVEAVVHPLPAAEGERSLLRQVFENLVQNAVKFTRHTANARIEIGHEQRDEADVYFVRDNGVGFDMQYADKLFGVFQRLHRAEDFEGTGVGLAIVDRIVRRHGGRVWADSVVNGGATFYFTLGRDRPAA